MHLSTLLIDVGDNPDRPRPGRLWLRNLYRVHQRLCMAFPSVQRKQNDGQFLKPFTPEDFSVQAHQADQPPEKVGDALLRQVHARRDTKSGFLFRVDPLPGGRAVILVQSAVWPDWEYAFGLKAALRDDAGRPIGNAGYLLAGPPAVKEYDPVFAADQRLRFRLMANPTKKTKTLSKEERLARVPKRHGCRVPVPSTPEDLLGWLTRRAQAAGFSVSEMTSLHPGYVYVNKTAGPGKGQRLRSVRYEGILQVTDPDAFGNTLAAGIGPAKGFGFGLLSVARA